jgi:hypothetical protein
MSNIFDNNFITKYIHQIKSFIDFSFIDSKLEVLIKAPKYWFVKKLEKEAGLYFHYPITDYNVFIINLFRIYVELDIDTSCLIFPLIYMSKLKNYKYLITKYNFIKIFLVLCILGIKYQNEYYISIRTWVNKCFHNKILRTENLSELTLDFVDIEYNLLNIFDYNLFVNETEYSYFYNLIV